MKYVFIINPVAGKGNLQDGIIESIDTFFANKNEEYVIYKTTRRGDAKEFAIKEADSGQAVRIYIGGGEGTFFEVLNGVAEYDNVELGVIPCGSANDFLKVFDSKETFFNIDAQINGESTEMDLIKANEHYCMNGCSIGMDAMVAHDMSIFKHWPFVSGELSYKLAIVKNFLRRSISLTAEISVDGEKRKKYDCLFAVVGNGTCYGGSFYATPKAVPNDGILDYTLVDVICRVRVPKFLSYYQKGTHEALDYCHLRTCETMEFWTEKPIPVNLDGEIFEENHMLFRIVKKALKFIVPSGVKPKLLTND